MIGARFAAVDAALTRLLGPEVIASDDMITLAALVRDAAGACTPEGRPLYAGHADLDWPEAPHLVMWHALTLLREHRGDGHIAALTSAGLSGIEALVTHSATGKGFLAAFARASRGWSQEEWDAAVGELAARGLLVDECALTEAGQALRAQIEDDTDRMAAAPWQYLGERAHRGSHPDRQGHEPHRLEGRRHPPRRRLPHAPDPVGVADDLVGEEDQAVAQGPGTA